jgi:hypothetical protein
LEKSLGNGDENYKKIPPHTDKDGYYQKGNKTKTKIPQKKITRVDEGVKKLKPLSIVV